MDKKLNLLKSKQDDSFSLIANIIGSFASPVRLKLIHFLSQSPLTVEVLAQKIDQTVANTSMHLRKMLSEKIVNVEVVGQKRLYSLKPGMLLFWEQCQNFCLDIDSSIRLPVEDVYGDVNWKFSDKETVQMIKNKELIILDVRPDDETSQLNISDYNFIIHLSASKVKDKLKDLPKRKKILVMCRGRLCALSAHTVNVLRENDFKAYRLEKSWFELSNILPNDIE